MLRNGFVSGGGDDDGGGGRNGSGSGSGWGGGRVVVLGAVHKVRHAILDHFWPPPSVTLCHTSRDPLKVRQASRTPNFLVVHAYIHRSLQGRLSQFAEVFDRGILSRVVFVRPPFCQNASITTEN